MLRASSKLVVLFTACALLASGCTKSGTAPLTTGGGSYGSGVKLPKEQQQSSGSGNPTSNGSNGVVKNVGGGVTPPPGYKPYTGGQASGNITGRNPNDNGNLGTNAYFYMNRSIPKLIVEIDAVHGMAPDPATVSLLRQRLASVIDKPGGLDILPIQDIGAGQSTWTIPQVKAKEDKVRNNYSTEKAAVLYLIFVNGRPNPTGPIGVAYNASSDVIFEEEIRNAAATPLVSAVAIEKATVIHEVGHLLSLVNIGYQSPRKHEDAQHPGHSNNPASVMYWAVDNVGVANLLGGRTQPPNDYDADDRADLADVRSGKLRSG